jgi:glycerol-3-phosphate dehydrogenase
MSLKNLKFPLKGQFSKGVHIITRCLIKKYAVAIAINQKHADALIQRGGRHFFIMPWRNHSLIGTTNVPFDGSPDERMVTERDVSDLIQEVNIAYPAANIKREDVVHSYGGLYPDDIKNKFENGYQGDRKDQIIDHSPIDGLEGLITVTNVKYTTARKLAQRTIDLVFKKIGYKPPKCLTEYRYVHGGEINQFDEYLSREVERNSSKLDERILKHLIYNYGTGYTQIMNYIDYNRKWGEVISNNLPIIKAQILHAIRNEMALKLSDVVFRRTGLGTLGNPGEQSLEICSKIMAEELAWDDARTINEIIETREVFSLH